MNEYSKTKIGFALALLAALFTLSPIVNNSTFSFVVFSFEVTIKILYWVFSALLALCVYFYALTFIRLEKVHNVFQKTGNYIYAVSLLFLPFIICLYIIYLLSNVIIDVFNSPKIGEYLSFALSLISALFGLYTTFITARRMKKTDDTINAEKSKIRELALLDRAKKLSKDGMYDLTIVDLWNVIETSFYRFFEEQGITHDKKRPISIINTIKENNLLPSALTDELSVIRELRNKAAHGVGDINEQQIDLAFNTVEKILAYIHSSEQCYYCGKTFPKFELEQEELFGDYFACKKCAKEHPNWQDEILSLGMDP